MLFFSSYQYLSAVVYNNTSVAIVLEWIIDQSDFGSDQCDPPVDYGSETARRRENKDVHYVAT